MHALRVAVGAAAMGAMTGLALGATKLSPSEIQAGFFNGQPFTASTLSNIKFKMVFMPDGKVTREPIGKSGVKGDGTWRLSSDGFCTTWKGSKATCYTVMTRGDKEWAVMKGSSAVAVWTK